MEIRKHMIFSGEVQGVGFRYTAYMAARELGLTGWVANLSDGRVEMEVQGTQKEILHLVDKIKKTGQAIKKGDSFLILKNVIGGVIEMYDGIIWT